MATIFRAKGLAQGFGKVAQGPIALGKAIFVVVVLHPTEVNIQENGEFALIQQKLSSCFGQLEEVS